METDASYIWNKWGIIRNFLCVPEELIMHPGILCLNSTDVNNYEKYLQTRRPTF